MLAQLHHLREPLHHLGVVVREEAGGLRVERRDLRHLAVREREVKDVQVLLHALAVHGLRDDHHAALEVPPQHDLRRRLAVRLADTREHGVLEQPAATLAERRPRLGRHAVFRLPFHELRLLVQRMRLHLVHHGLHVVELAELHHAVHVEVRDADGTDLALLVKAHQVAPRTERVAKGLMQQHEVQVVGAQLAQGVLHRGSRGTLTVVLDPDLRGEKDVRAVHARGLDGSPYLLLVEVALRRVDVPIAHLKGVADAALALIRRHLVHAVAELRHLHAVRKRHVHHVVCHAGLPIALCLLDDAVITTDSYYR